MTRAYAEDRGRTVGQMIEAQIDQLMKGETPRLLPEAT